MKSDDVKAEEVLKHLLAEVRLARCRRRAVKMAAASALVALGAWMAIDRPAPPHEIPMVEQRNHEALSEEKLAVVVWRNGVPNLEELGGDRLADLELDFSLEPVSAFALEDPWSRPGG